MVPSLYAVVQGQVDALGSGSWSGLSCVLVLHKCCSSKGSNSGSGSDRYIWVPLQEKEVRRAFDNVTNLVNVGNVHL
jgi:hypothetical protein